MTNPLSLIDKFVIALSTRDVILADESDLSTAEAEELNHADEPNVTGQRLLPRNEKINTAVITYMRSFNKFTWLRQDYL